MRLSAIAKSKIARAILSTPGTTGTGDAAALALLADVLKKIQRQGAVVIVLRSA
jgi:hypothetical protein